MMFASYVSPVNVLRGECSLREWARLQRQVSGLYRAWRARIASAANKVAAGSPLPAADVWANAGSRHAAGKGLPAATARPADAPPRRLLVVPCDPWSVAGSRGDEAMIVAASGCLNRRYPGLEMAVLTADSVGSAAARQMGLRPFEVWRGTHLLDSVFATVEEFDPDLAVVAGGDVMDGYYSPYVSLALLATADLLARRGTRTSLLGFSCNARPASCLRAAYGLLDSRLRLNVRDPVSWARLRRFVPGSGRLVADIAFLLKPDPGFTGYDETAAWVAGRKAKGDRVLAVNVHPMLIRQAQSAQIETLAATVAEALAGLIASRPVSFLLLPHDYREQVGDRHCLEPMQARLAVAHPERVRYVSSEHSAAQLKALVGLADGLVGSRMHLVIAALGMGVPVAAFAYQGKFEGLFQHFELPDWLFCEPPLTAVRAPQLTAFLDRFTGALDTLRPQVAARLPGVRTLAELNVEL